MKEKICFDCISIEFQGAKPYEKAYGQLVLLGFAISDFTPAAYQRHRL